MLSFLEIEATFTLIKTTIPISISFRNTHNSLSPVFQATGNNKGRTWRSSIMDAPDTTKVVFQRLMLLDPENAFTIFGYIHLQDHGELDMIRLAFAPDVIIKSVIEKAKQALKLSPTKVTSNRKDKQVVVSENPIKFTSFEPSSSHHAPYPQVNNSLIEKHTPTYQPITNNNIENVPFSYFSSPFYGFSFHKQPHSPPVESQNGHGSHSGNAQELERGPKPNMSKVLPELKFCYQFKKGVCTVGVRCKFMHCERLTNDLIMIVNSRNAFDVVKEYHVFSHGSVKKLEMEVSELLKSKGMDPVPVSTLPDLYRERYGRELEVTGYYTENYMQVKLVCDLNEVVIHLTNGIRMIKRNGEICVILAEKVQKNLNPNDEQDKGLARSPACQVYVTFSPESAFTEYDLYYYFINYGSVKSVRLPDQLQTMYGFVTFFNSVTVTAVLDIGNPHLIDGKKLQVKPYKVNHRKANGNLQRSGGSLTDGGSRNLSTPGPSESVSFPKKQLIIKEHDGSVDDKKTFVWRVKGTCSSNHNSSNKAEGCSAPQGMSHCSKGGCIDCARIRKGKGVVTRNCKEERFEEVKLPDDPFAL